MLKKILVMMILNFLLGPGFVLATMNFNSGQFQNVISQLDMQGHADHDLSNCTVKQVYYEEVIAALNDGKSAEDIISTYVEEYGQAALRTPATKGSGLLAWAMPAVGVIFGGVIVGVWIKKVAKQSKQAPEISSSLVNWEDGTDKEIFARMLDEERRKYF